MIRVRFFLLAAVIIWGWTFVATKICLDYMSPLELMGLRFLIALPAMFAMISARKVPLRFSTCHRQLAIGSVILTIHFWIQITGIKYTTATNTGWIIAVTPLVMAVLAWLILKERVGRNTVAGIALSAVGILLLVSKGDPGALGGLSTLGDWLVLASAPTWALYTIATRKVSRTFDPMAVTFAVLLPAAILALTVMAFTTDWSKFLLMSTEALVALLALGFLGTALAHWFWQEGVARVGTTEAGSFLYLEPIATTALAVPYLGESFGVYTAIGGALILFGVWWAQRRKRAS